MPFTAPTQLFRQDLLKREVIAPMSSEILNHTVAKAILLCDLTHVRATHITDQGVELQKPWFKM